MGEVYVVTGAGSGIGKAILKNLPKEVFLVAADKARERLEQVTETLRKEGFSIASFVVDVSVREEVKKLASFASSQGQVKKVFHCAGVSGSMVDRESILKINALGTVYINQEFYQVMNQGIICDFASNSGYILPRFLMPSERVYRMVLKDEKRFLKAMYHRTGFVLMEKWNQQIAYLTSKNFVRWYSQKCSFRYWETKSIRVFSISPGYVNTPMTEVEDGFLSRNLLTYTAFGKGAEPEEIAYLAIHLADERCSYLMGTDIHADGGCIDNGYSLKTVFWKHKRRDAKKPW